MQPACRVRFIEFGASFANMVQFSNHCCAFSIALIAVFGGWRRNRKLLPPNCAGVRRMGALNEQLPLKKPMKI